MIVLLRVEGLILFCTCAGFVIWNGDALQLKQVSALLVLNSYATFCMASYFSFWRMACAVKRFPGAGVLPRVVCLEKRVEVFENTSFVLTSPPNETAALGLQHRGTVVYSARRNLALPSWVLIVCTPAWLAPVGRWFICALEVSFFGSR